MSALEAKQLRFKGLRTAAIIIATAYLVLYIIAILSDWKNFIDFDKHSIMELGMFLLFIAGFIISFKNEIMGGILILLVSIMLASYYLFTADYLWGSILQVPLAAAGVFFIIVWYKNRH